MVHWLPLSGKAYISTLSPFWLLTFTGTSWRKTWRLPVFSGVSPSSSRVWLLFRSALWMKVWSWSHPFVKQVRAEKHFFALWPDFKQLKQSFFLDKTKHLSVKFRFEWITFIKEMWTFATGTRDFSIAHLSSLDSWSFSSSFTPIARKIRIFGCHYTCL